jgi:hypothetical protein
MSQSTVSAAMLSLLLAAALTPADARGADAGAATDDSARVIGANDIYRVKIESLPTTPDSDRVRTPIEVFGKAGYYLYDTDAWDMVSSDPFIAALRGRPYSLYGSELDAGTLNRWTMRSEHIRHDDFDGSDADPRPSWSYPGWRFW